MENGKLTGAESLESIETLSSGTTSVSMRNAVASSSAIASQVRTLFVSGLPIDVKSRELYLLFRAYPGYQSSLVRVASKNGRTASPVGFVTFASKEQAEDVLKTLQGIPFDPETGQTIRLELARSNTKVPKPKQQISPPTPILPQPPQSVSTTFPPGVLQAAAAAAAASAAPQPFFAPPPPPSLSTSNPHHQHHNPQDLVNAAAAAAAASCLGDPHVAQFLNDHQFLLSAVPQFATAPVAQPPPFLLPPAAAAAAAAAAAGLPIPPAVATTTPSSAAAAAAAFLQPNSAFAHLAAAQHAAQLNAATSANLVAAVANASVAAAAASGPACSTLFVANLANGVSEEELKMVFRAYPGFSRLRLHTKGVSTVAFVEFGDIRQATMAMNALQGTEHTCTDRGGFRIEYARNKMGDVNGQWNSFRGNRQWNSGH